VGVERIRIDLFLPEHEKRRVVHSVGFPPCINLLVYCTLNISPELSPPVKLKRHTKTRAHKCGGDRRLSFSTDNRTTRFPNYATRPTLSLSHLHRLSPCPTLSKTLTLKTTSPRITRHAPPTTLSSPATGSPRPRQPSAVTRTARRRPLSPQSLESRLV